MSHPSLAAFLLLSACAPIGSLDSPEPPQIDQDATVKDSPPSGTYSLVDATSYATLGYRYESSNAWITSACSGRTSFGPMADGTCTYCIDPAESTKVTDGRWEELYMEQSSTLPSPLEDADLRCVGCYDAPAYPLAWWTFEDSTAGYDTAYGVDMTWFPSDGSADTLFAFPGASLLDEGQVMRGISFDGSGYALSPDAIGSDDDVVDVGTGSFTIQMWIRLDSTDATSSTRVLLDKRDAAGIGYSTYLSSRKPGIQLADSTGYTNFTSSTALAADGQWHQLTFIVDRTSATGLKIYRDTTPLYTGNPTSRAGNLSNAADLYVGTRSPDMGGGATFSGDLDELQIYSKALTASERARQYASRIWGNCR